jgi:hypothetical protein
MVRTHESDQIRDHTRNIRAYFVVVSGFGIRPCFLGRIRIRSLQWGGATAIACPPAPRAQACLIFFSYAHTLCWSWFSLHNYKKHYRNVDWEKKGGGQEGKSDKSGRGFNFFLICGSVNNKFYARVILTTNVGKINNFCKP